MPNPTDVARIAAACPATFGREATSHAFVTVTHSTTHLTPYRMCSKCGLTDRHHLGEKQ